MRVKLTMRRARVILTPLLPALWLVASVNCLFDPLSSFTSGPSTTLVSAAPRANREATPSTSSLEQSARRWSRRLDDQSGPGTPSPVAFCRTQDTHFARAASEFTHAHLLLALSQGWQFHWRTAAEPRAPSFVS